MTVKCGAFKDIRSMKVLTNKRCRTIHNLCYGTIGICGRLLVFRRKDLCEARPKPQIVFRFPDVLFALKSDGPRVDEALGQGDIFSDLWSG